MTYSMDTLKRWYILNCLKLNFLLKNHQVFDPNSQIQPPVPAILNTFDSTTNFELVANTETDELTNRGQNPAENDPVFWESDPILLTKKMKETIMDFESTIVAQIKSPYVAYHWVKMLYEMIACDRALMSQNEFENFCKNMKLKTSTSVIISKLLKESWLQKIGPGWFI